MRRDVYRLDDFFALDRFAVLLRDVLFFAAPLFFELPRVEDDFFAAFFFAAPFLGMFAPASRASLNAIAIACFGFFTFLRPPDFNSPCLYSCMTFSTFLRPFACDAERDDREELDELFFEEPDFLVANVHPPSSVDVLLPDSVSLLRARAVSTSRERRRQAYRP
jgi:hypothetical protein